MVHPFPPALDSSHRYPLKGRSVDVRVLCLSWAGYGSRQELWTTQSWAEQKKRGGVGGKGQAFAKESGVYVCVFVPLWRGKKISVVCACRHQQTLKCFSDWTFFLISLPSHIIVHESRPLRVHCMINFAQHWVILMTPLAIYVFLISIKKKCMCIFAHWAVWLHHSSF